MKKSPASKLALFLVLAVIAIGAIPARATTFGFNDEYYISTLGEFHTIFGSSTTGYNTPGIYQRTDSNVPTVVQLSASGTTGSIAYSQAVPGEFIQNGTPDANAGLALSGWGQFNGSNGTNGANVSSIYTLGNSIASLQYRTGITNSLLSGGAVTDFTLNSIDLFTAAPGTATGYDIEGLLNGVVVDQELVCTNGNQDAVAPVGGSCGTYVQSPTVTFNWSNIDTVEIGFINGSGTLIPWPGDGTLFMDNVTINNSIPPVVPEPASLTLLGTGLLGLSGLIRRKMRG